IPWPIGKRGRSRNSLIVFKDSHRLQGLSSSSRTLIVFKDLAKAFRRESNQAVARWWGVTPQTVSKWRKALGVGFATEGTSQLHRETIEEPGDAMRALSALKARDPERRRKIAVARRGKPRPPHVGQAVAEAHRGTHHSAESRRKMRATHRRRG